MLEISAGSTFIIASNALLINMATIVSLKESKRVFWLIFGNVNLIILVMLMFFEVKSLYIRILFVAELFILHLFPVERCKKLISKRFYYCCIFIFVANSASILGTQLFNNSIANVFAAITSVLSWICSYYCYYSTGKLIRSSPLSKYDQLKMRIERLSNIILVCAGVTEIVGIVAGFMGIVPIVLMAIHFYIYATSEYLLELNKYSASTTTSQIE